MFVCSGDDDAEEQTLVEEEEEDDIMRLNQEQLEQLGKFNFF